MVIIARLRDRTGKVARISSFVGYIYTGGPSDVNDAVRWTVRPYKYNSDHPTDGPGNSTDLVAVAIQRVTTVAEWKAPPKVSTRWHHKKSRSRKISGWPFILKLTKFLIWNKCRELVAWCLNARTEGICIKQIKVFSSNGFVLFVCTSDCSRRPMLCVDRTSGNQLLSTLRFMILLYIYKHKSQY